MSEVQCELCGHPMPEGEEMFKYHGYSCPCPVGPKATPPMVCKRGDRDCDMCGCDCYMTASMDSINAELQEAGINLSDLEKRTKAVVRLASQAWKDRARIAELEAEVLALRHAADPISSLATHDAAEGIGNPEGVE